MPEFRYIQLTNSLTSGASIYPTVVGEGGVVTASDESTPQGKTVNYDLAAYEGNSVAIGAFVAAPDGRQAQSGSFMTVSNSGNIYGYFELTGSVDNPTMNFNGYGDPK